MEVKISKDIISVCPTCGEQYADGNVEKLRNDLNVAVEALEALELYREGCAWYDGDKIVDVALERLKGKI